MNNIYPDLIKLYWFGHRDPVDCGLPILRNEAEREFQD